MGLRKTQTTQKCMFQVTFSIKWVSCKVRSGLGKDIGFERLGSLDSNDQVLVFTQQRQDSVVQRPSQVRGQLDATPAAKQPHDASSHHAETAHGTKYNTIPTRAMQLTCQSHLGCLMPSSSPCDFKIGCLQLNYE